MKNQNDPADYGEITEFNPVPLKSLKKGEYFTLKPIGYPNDNQVFIKGDYVHGERKYGCTRCSDVFGDWKLVKGDKLVYTNFIY